MHKIKYGYVAFLCIAALFILIVLVIGVFNSDSCIPSSLEIKADSVVFASFNDEKVFTRKSQEFPKLLGLQSASQLANISEPAAADFGQRLGNMIEALKNDFKAKGKIFSVPIGTRIRIKKLCDENGTEIKPVWNDAQKCFYTAAGSFVWVSGEWQGKSVVTILQ